MKQQYDVTVQIMLEETGNVFSYHSADKIPIKLSSWGHLWTMTCPLPVISSDLAPWSLLGRAPTLDSCPNVNVLPVTVHVNLLEFSCCKCIKYEQVGTVVLPSNEYSASRLSASLLVLPIGWHASDVAAKIQWDHPEQVG